MPFYSVYLGISVHISAVVYDLLQTKALQPADLGLLTISPNLVQVAHIRLGLRVSVCFMIKPSWPSVPAVRFTGHLSHHVFPHLYVNCRLRK